MVVSKYLYWSCKMLAYKIVAEGSGGSVFHNMNKSAFSSLELLDADLGVIKAFDQLIEPVHDLLLCNEIENQVIAMLRDEALPKLVSEYIELGFVESSRTQGPI